MEISEKINGNSKRGYSKKKIDKLGHYARRIGEKDEEKPKKKKYQPKYFLTI